MISPSKMSGAPLDMIKGAAAAFMLADDVNSALVDPPSLVAWRFGRIAFPLFCFVLSCHLARGMSAAPYALRLLVLGTLTQPFFTAAFPWSPSQASILFTLAAGSALAATQAASPAPQRGAKHALVLDLLGRGEGASVPELMSATGWLPHTSRAALSRLRSSGTELLKSPREDGQTAYRIVAEEPAPKRTRARTRQAARAEAATA